MRAVIVLFGILLAAAAAAESPEFYAAREFEDESLSQMQQREHRRLWRVPTTILTGDGTKDPCAATRLNASISV